MTLLRRRVHLTRMGEATNLVAMTVIVKSSTTATEQPVDRDVWVSFRRGWKQCCPACGKGRLFKSYLKVNDACPACGEELHHQRADDAPPYFTMMITGHLIVGGILVIEKNFALDLWIQMAIWLPLTVLLSLWLLPRVKGALIGYQWANRMHGFGPGAFEGADLVPEDPLPSPAP